MRPYTGLDVDMLAVALLWRLRRYDAMALKCGCVSASKVAFWL